MKLCVALAGLLLPRPDRPCVLAWAPLVTLALAVALVLAFSYRTAGPRATEAAWTDGVARARSACSDPITGSVYIFPRDGTVLGLPVWIPMRDGPPPGFGVLVPCDRLR